MSYIIETIRGAWMLLGFTAGGSLVGLLLTMSVFRDIIESIFIDGLTEKEYLDYLRRTERRKYSASKMVRIYKERPRKFSSSIMTYRIVSLVFLAIHLILTAVIIICTFLPIHFGARQALGLMAANLIIGRILETLYKRLSSQTAAGDKLLEVFTLDLARERTAGHVQFDRFDGFFRVFTLLGCLLDRLGAGNASAGDRHVDREVRRCRKS